MNTHIRNIMRCTIIVLMLTIVWCIWSESVAPGVVAQGLIMGSLALFTTNRFLLRGSYQHRYAVGIPVLLKYIAVVFVQIFRSGFDAIYITVTDRINVGVVDLPTDVDDPVVGALIANAITVTPGTVTIDFDNNNFKVVWINCVTTDPVRASRIIKEDYEQVFRRK